MGINMFRQVRLNSGWSYPVVVLEFNYFSKFCKSVSGKEQTVLYTK